jgi:hypothetical protein
LQISQRNTSFSFSLHPSRTLNHKWLRKCGESGGVSGAHGGGRRIPGIYAAGSMRGKMRRRRRRWRWRQREIPKAHQSHRIKHAAVAAANVAKRIYNNFVIQRGARRARDIVYVWCGRCARCVSARRGRGLVARRLPSDAPKPLREPPRRDQCWEPAHGTSTLFIRLLVGYIRTLTP